MIESGFNRKKVLGFFGADSSGDLRAVEFLFPGFGEGFIHVGTDDERVGGLPGLRLVFEEFEFDGEIPLVLFDEFIDATGVGFHDDARLFVKQGGVAIGGGTKAKKAEMLVNGKSNGAEDFGELTAGDAAEQIHLPQAILRHDVALGFGHVGERGGANVRDAPDVAVDGDLILQPGERGGAVDLRQGTEEKPPGQAATGKDQKSQKPTEDAECESQREPSKKCENSV